MKLDLRSLLAGEIKSYPFSFTLEPQGTDDPQSPLFGVDFTEPIRIVGTVVNNAGYIRMTADMVAPYRTPCARCLADVDGKFTLTAERTVVTPKDAAGMDEDTEDDYLVTEDGFLSADELFLDLLEMNFPFKILCREDCRGLCQRCGADLNLGPCSCKGDPPDPRIAGPLAGLLEKLRKEEAQNP